MTPLTLTATDILHPGTATGTVLKLDEPLSFWGGFDPTNGAILDKAHPQAGQSVTNKILALPGSRGSAGTPAGIAEALRRQVGPAAILLLNSDVNITIGAQVAQRLYDHIMPVLVVSGETMAALQSDTHAAIRNDSIHVTEGR